MQGGLVFLRRAGNLGSSRHVHSVRAAIDRLQHSPRFAHHTSWFCKQYHQRLGACLMFVVGVFSFAMGIYT